MISVITSAYRENPGVFEKAVNSVLDQLDPDSELILVLDDPDNSELVSWVGEKLTPMGNVIVLKNKKNLGLAQSLNRAIDHASGDYIARMDADDVSLPGRFETQLAYLLEHNYDLIGSRVNVIDAEGAFLYETPQSPLSPDKVNKALKWNNCLAHPTWFGRKEVFAQKYREIPLCEDYDFQIRAVLSGFKLGNCDAATLNYRLSDEGLSRSSLFQQYLYQKILTKEYKKGNSVNIEQAKAFVEEGFSETKAVRYSKANDYFQEAMQFFMQKRIGSAVSLGIRSIFLSAPYRDKIRRLVLTSLG